MAAACTLEASAPDLPVPERLPGPHDHEHRDTRHRGAPAAAEFARCGRARGGRGEGSRCGDRPERPLRRRVRRDGSRATRYRARSRHRAEPRRVREGSQWALQRRGARPVDSEDNSGVRQLRRPCRRRRSTNALLLLDALEEAEAGESNGFISLDDTLGNGAKYCQCGYASSRTVPERLCPLCSGAVLNEWRAEEDRLLKSAPGVGADLEVVFDGLLDELAGIHLAPGGVAASTSARRRAGDRGITRVNETRAAEIALLNLARWRELCELNALGQTMAVTARSKYWSRWGLGSARISTLAVVSAPELQARMRKVSGSRPAPNPTFFERLFSRR